MFIHVNWISISDCNYNSGQNNRPEISDQLSTRINFSDVKNYSWEIQTVIFYSEINY